MIINREIDIAAKKFNSIYDNIRIVKKTENSTASERSDPDTEWNKLEMFKRESSKASAYRSENAKEIYTRLARQYGAELTDKINSLTGTEGKLFSDSGSEWKMRLSDSEFISTARDDGFAYDVIAAEHRRWCMFMISIGWKCGEKKLLLKQNPCILPQNKLEELHPEMVKYDIMPLLMVQKDREKENIKNG